MTLFAMNIYRRIFVRDEISTGEYLFAMNIYLLRVDFLHPRIFQADTWLMHCSAEKKEFLHSSLLQNVTVFRF